MKALKKMFEWLLVSRKSDYLDDHPDLNPLDVDELKEELNVEHEARNLGEKGLPRPDAKKPSGPEVIILQHIERARHNAVGYAFARVKSLNSQMQSCDITKIVNRALNASSEFEHEANSYLSDSEANIRRLREEKESKEENLREFKLHNRLNRTAKEVSLTDSLVYGIFVLGVIIGEGWANAQFFAKGLDGGLAQGFIYAFFLALMNVVVALTIGLFFVPYKNHISRWKQYFGFFSLLASISFIVIMGLVIAHFRNSLSKGSDDPFLDTGKQALESFVSTPLGLGDMYTWMLFAISIMCGALALFKGYRWFDPYPGFSRIQKTTNQAILDYENELEEVREYLQKLKNDHLESLDESLNQADSAISNLKQHIYEKGSCSKKLNGWLDNAENVGCALIAVFRTQNQSYRQKLNLPDPSYFEDKVEYKEIEWPNFDTSDDEKSLEEQKNRREELLTSIEKMRASIKTSFDSRFDQLKPIREQIK